MNMNLPHLAGAIYKRAVAVEVTVSEPALPSWALAVWFADLLFFLPLIFWTVYTVHQVYPIFVIIEDEKPPHYDPVKPTDDEAAISSTGPVPTGKILFAGCPASVTPSLRSMNRLLKAHGGCSANLRGFSVYWVHNMAMGALFALFSGFLPEIIASLAILPAALSLVQLSTAWVHIVITPRSSKHFWQRLPPFKRTFDATALPVAIYWLAEQVGTWIPIVISRAIKVDLPDLQWRRSSSTPPSYLASDAWKSIIVLLTSLAFQAMVIIPAQVILVRIQASLLPTEETTIIPFDRSFEGRVRPPTVGGKGYATMDDAWSAFSHAAWKRLAIFYAKIFAVTLAVFSGMAGALYLQFILISKYTR